MRIRSLMLGAAGAVLIPAMASASHLTPGQWSLGGIQQICVTSSNTWYGTTFAAWHGAWRFDGGLMMLYGNYASGAGNDSITVGGLNVADWVEWRDDLSFQTVVDDVQITFVKTVCDPPAASVNSPIGDPLAKK